MQVKEAVPVLTGLQSNKVKICSHSLISHLRTSTQRYPVQFIRLRMRLAVQPLWERVHAAIFLALVSFDAFSPQGRIRSLSVRIADTALFANNTQVVGGDL